MSYLQKDDKIFVAGHNGLVGGAITVALKERGYSNIVTRDRKSLDLLDAEATRDFFSQEKPDVVFVAAAKVGGILANNTYRADFIFQNIQVQNNIIWNAHLNDVKRLVFLGSSCIYPRQSPQPMRENSLLIGHLEYTNRPYAIAKIAGIELINGLREQYGRDYFSVMPTNLYGPRDNFHPENSHVIPALIRRFSASCKDQNSSLTVWGSGTPKREFMFSRDCADAIVFLAENVDKNLFKDPMFEHEKWSHINVGTGEEVSIAEVAYMIKEVSGFKGEIKFDVQKPDGTMRKLLDCSVLKEMGWRPSTCLKDGLSESYKWFNNNY